MSKIIFFASILYFIMFACWPAHAALDLTDKLPEKSGKSGRVMQALLNNIDGQRSAVVSIQRELVARPALNPEAGGNSEEEKARWIESWLHVWHAATVLAAGIFVGRSFPRQCMPVFYIAGRGLYAGAAVLLQQEKK